MNPLVTILRASCCRSTHHRFALDALPLVQTAAGKRLVAWLLRHHDRYLTGAIDPDIRYRDFQNHVIHVREGYWGGAPRVAHQWYDRLQRYLRENRFGDAAHAAGVLSHYFTDVLQPLHTAICDRERILHRPIEWSVYWAYDAILRRWHDDDMRVVFQISDRPQWLGEAMLHGARFANRKRELLLNQYAIDRLVDDPADALNGNCRAALAELLGLAITGLARIFERAAADAESMRGGDLPTAGLLTPCLLAVARAPLDRTLGWLSRWQTRKAMKMLVAEYQQRGRLEKSLPDEVDIIHRVVQIYHDEQRWRRHHRNRESTGPIDEPTVSLGKIGPSGSTIDPSGTEAVAIGQGDLSPQAGLAEAPSIGPKTAARFAAIEINTVAEFLSARPDVIAERLMTYWITAATIRQWQAQAMLKCQVPGLSDGHCQLLVGSGCGSPAELAASDPSDLHQAILRCAATASGRRHLRGDRPPRRLDVARWIRDAADVLAPASLSRRSA